MEIERKFLVKDMSFMDQATEHYDIVQSYMVSEPDKQVRLRRKNGVCTLTIKGPLEKDGVSRYEFEKQITDKEYIELSRLCNPNVINKIRYIIDTGIGPKWEVDVFLGTHIGLILAEIELKSANIDFEKPSWLGEEVTGDERFYNVNL